LKKLAIIVSRHSLKTRNESDSGDQAGGLSGRVAHGVPALPDFEIGSFAPN